MGYTTLGMGGGEGREAEVPLWVGPNWTPGDYPARLEATASGYEGVVAKPFTLRVR